MKSYFLTPILISKHGRKKKREYFWESSHATLSSPVDNTENSHKVNGYNCINIRNFGAAFPLRRGRPFLDVQRSGVEGE